MTDTLTQFRCDVLGAPAAQGSKRHVGGGRLIEASAALGPWRQHVADRVREAAAEQHLHWGPREPVIVALAFRLYRPLSASPRKIIHVRRPDLDKLCRAVLDALVIAGLIADDAQVIELHASKRMARVGEGVGVRICVYEVPAL